MMEIKFVVQDNTQYIPKITIRTSTQDLAFENVNAQLRRLLHRNGVKRSMAYKS